MRIKKLTAVCALVLVVVFNCLTLIEGKKVLLGLIGLHALRRLERMNHVRKLVTFVLPLRYAKDAWKSYGKVAATTPHLPNILKSGDLHHSESISHPKSVKLSAEQSYDLDKWLNHYFPEEIMPLVDHNIY